MCLGLENDYDLKNYHWYEPFMILNGKLDFDIVPAHRQNFHAPLQDLVFYGTKHLLWDYPSLLKAVLSVPAAVAAFLGTCLASSLIPDDIRGRRIFGGIAAGLGATGAAGLPTLATTMSEMMPAALMLAGLLLIIGRNALQTRVPIILSAAILFGGALGLKLTNMPFCAALAIALPIGCAETVLARLRLLAVLGVGMVIGAAITAGPWWAYLYMTFGNPIFPYYNNVFHSPFFEHIRLTDDTFLPATPLRAVFFPLFWAFHRSRIVSEPALRDPRFAIALLLTLLMLLHAFLVWCYPKVRDVLHIPPAGPRERFLLIFFILSYAGWEWMFSIFRYLAPVEMISGLIILLPVLALLRIGRMRLAAAMAAGIILVTGAVTRYPAWGRLPYAEKSIQVTLPDLGSSALVVLLDKAPLAYLATYAPVSVQFVGVNNGFMAPGQDNLLARRIAAVIADAKGPVWGLETLEPGKPPLADESLAYYRLRRDTCSRLQSNLEEQPIQICRLRS